jgi:hypothetical protein
MPIDCEAELACDLIQRAKTWGNEIIFFFSQEKKRRVWENAFLHFQLEDE